MIMLIALLTTRAFYPHHVEVADQDPASRGLYADVIYIT